MKLDAPLYTEEELDALERENPREALRIAREQAVLRKQLESAVPAGAQLPQQNEIADARQEARRILMSDGRDPEVSASGADARGGELAGACAACPRPDLHRKRVVDELAAGRFSVR